ncbi:unnamed protein product [Caenorhabditis angaria]|uniref:Uncharacterized protein n=1 Tax=Caenorhabditis angaria TaxID=860376 RepID=A0A9P1IRM7_9PELO|nr:unnamed protein product [Caenorhabditis angaria]
MATFSTTNLSPQQEQHNNKKVPIKIENLMDDYGVMTVCGDGSVSYNNFPYDLGQHAFMNTSYSSICHQQNNHQEFNQFSL